MDRPITVFKVFYSWQSDSGSETNEKLIRRCLSRAISDLNDSSEFGTLRIEIDEATRDMSGSQNIPLTILNQINACDAVFADLTPTASTLDGSKVPNPNVVFELGYAVALLGWPRVVILFNRELGTFPGDLPFDFDRHRASDYSATPLSDDASSKQRFESSRANLVNICRTALRQILRSNPERPATLKASAPELIKHQRDLETLRYLLTCIPINALEAHVQNLPTKIEHSIFVFWEGFDAMWQSSLTYIYDDVLRSLLGEFHDLWEETLSHGEFYRRWEGTEYYTFHPHPEDVTRHTKEHEVTWSKIENVALHLGSKLHGVIDKIRNDFMDIDLHASTFDAWERYRQEQEELAKRFQVGK
ncbi:MAG: TIR domain-containing protein [Isosphaeraceae bacterium]